MLRCEIIRTCSNEKVAEAAVLSVGSPFKDRVALLAAASGSPVGAYVAHLVRRFRDEANESDLAALTRATAGSDMPILDGLRWIVEGMTGDSRGNSAGHGLARPGGADRGGKAVRCAQAA
jgi:hypothetical protein